MNEYRPNFVIIKKIKVGENDSQNIHIKLRYPEHALYMISSKNKFRIWCVSLINNKMFDNFLTICILINAINIA
jgi:hypothetical protein